MRFAPTRLALALAIGTAAALPAHAQSLQAVYEAARGYDATYLAARALLDSAEYRVEQAKALRRPLVGLQAGATRTTADTPYASTIRADIENINATLNAQQSLYNKANAVTIEQAEKGFEASKADFELAEQDLIVRVAQAYFDVLAAQDALATQRTSKAAISEQLASAKRNFEVGTATITDTREAQARFDLSTALEIAADNDLRIRRIALDQLVGTGGVTPKGLAAPVTMPPVEPANAELWVGRADAEHPTIRKARLGLDVARLETEKARAGHLPTVALNASAGKGHVDTTGKARATTGIVLPIDAQGTATNTAIGITMNLPLFSGYAVQNRVKETLALEEKSSNDLEAARRGVAQFTRQVFYSVLSGEAQIKALEAAESSSQLALEAIRLGYRVGVRVNLDVLNSQTQLYTTQQQLAKARYDVIVGTLKLRQAGGVLKPADVAAVNQLLVR